MKPYISPRSRWVRLSHDELDGALRPHHGLVLSSLCGVPALGQQREVLDVRRNAPQEVHEVDATRYDWHRPGRKAHLVVLVEAGRPAAKLIVELLGDGAHDEATRLNDAQPIDHGRASIGQVLEAV